MAGFPAVGEVAAVGNGVAATLGAGLRSGDRLGGAAARRADVPREPGHRPEAGRSTRFRGDHLNDRRHTGPARCGDPTGPAPFPVGVRFPGRLLILVNIELRMPISENRAQVGVNELVMSQGR
jgi:hypothetical protein